MLPPPTGAPGSAALGAPHLPACLLPVSPCGCGLCREASIPSAGQFPALVTRPPLLAAVMCYACCMGTPSAYQHHDLSGCLTDSLYQFLLMHYLISCQSRARREACKVCPPVSLQGHVLQCAGSYAEVRRLCCDLAALH